MGQSKSKYRNKRRSTRQTFWLPLVVLGALLIIGAAAILLGSRGDAKPSGSTQSDPNFTPAVTGAPRVAVSQDYIDYGDVKLGTTVTTTFDIQNVGDQPLVILGEPQVELVEGC